MKKYLFIGILIGGIVFGTITGVVAYNYNAKDIGYTPSDSSWEVNNVSDAIKDLKSSTSAYVALFSGSRGISSTKSALPVTYVNNSYAIQDNNNIIIKKPGKYQIIGTASHAYSTYTTLIDLYINGEYNGLEASHSIVEWKIINDEVNLKENDVINVTIWSDGNTGKQHGGTVILIKK